MSKLRYEVLVNDGVQRHREMRLPDGNPIVSSPVASTLVLGDDAAVLVDPPFTYDQIDRVIAWVKGAEKRLAYIYATHGHGDHWFGADRIMRQFPGATAYATEKTIAMMHRQAQARTTHWDADFPGQIPDSPVVFEPIPRNGFSIEGHLFAAVETGHTDTDDTTVLHIPSLGLVVAGDVAYNGVHQYLLESRNGGLESWLAAIETVEGLHPNAVVAGHKNRALPDDPAILDQTRDYLVNARRLLAEKPAPRQFFDQMLALYPDRLNPGPLWYGAVELLS
jgi:glyoxylase-like metal-dependent hydrolase (beta-lactamase superfamily II)